MAAVVTGAGAALALDPRQCLEQTFNIVTGSRMLCLGLDLNILMVQDYTPAGHMHPVLFRAFRALVRPAASGHF